MPEIWQDFFQTDPRGSLSKEERIRLLSKRVIRGDSAYRCCRNRNVRDQSFLLKMVDVLEEAMNNQELQALAPGPGAVMAAFARIAAGPTPVVVRLAHGVPTLGAGIVIANEILAELPLPQSNYELQRLRSWMLAATDVMNRKSEYECLSCVEWRCLPQNKLREVVHYSRRRGANRVF